MAVMESLITEYDVVGYVRERTGAIIPNVAPSNVYPTSDGVGVLIAGNQDTVFKRLAAAMGRPELAEDPRYATHSARGATQAELDALIGEWTSTLDSEKLTAVLEEHGVPTGRIYRAKEMLEDSHIAAREAIIKIAHPLFGDIKMQGTFPKLSDTPGEVRWVGPELGEHTDAVLRDVLGYDEAKVEALRAAGVV
jgi:formyl-CoA transferase